MPWWSLTGDGTGLYVAGTFEGTIDFDPAANATANLTSAGGRDVVVARYAKQDGGLVRDGGRPWAFRYSGTGADQASQGHVLVDLGAGAVYVGGMFQNAVDFNPGGPGGDLVSRGDFDGFLLKLDGAGNYQDAWRMGGAGSDRAATPLGVRDGTVIFAAGFSGTADFPTGGTLISKGGSDIAVVAMTAPPAVSVAAGSGLEGASGRFALTFTISLSWAYGQPVTLSYRTADGTATAGSDYEAAEGTLTFAPGETTKTVTVWVFGDTLAELDETMFLDFTSLTTGVVAPGRTTGTVLNDD